MVLNALREWSLVCPKGDLANGSGKVESYSNLIERGFDPIQVAVARDR
jgi:integrase